MNIKSNGKSRVVALPSLFRARWSGASNPENISIARLTHGKEKKSTIKRKFKSNIRAARRSFAGVVCGSVLLIAANAQAQNLFVSIVSGSIYEYTPGGMQSTFASGLSLPAGLAYDSAGNLFESDTPLNGAAIYEFTPGGARTTFASGGVSSRAQGLAFNSAGILFAAAGSSIDEYTPGGAKSSFASLGGAVGLAFNSAGNLFVAQSNFIYEYTPGGAKSTFASGLNGASGLAFDSAGNLFEADANTGRIYEFTSAGAKSTFASGLAHPRGLAFDSAGNLFEADSGSHNIYEFAPDLTQSTFASGVTGPNFLAFQPVPEPSAFGLLAVGVTAILVRRRNFASVDSTHS